MIDARIPLGIQQFSLADIAQQAEQLKASRQQREYRQFEMDARKQQMESQKTLSSLLPRAVHGDAQARQEVANVGTPEALDWYMKLDDRSKAAEKAKIADMVQATRWADAPDKWELVKQSYRAQGVEVPDVPFEQREQVMVELGQIGAYMESAPKLELKTTEPGGGLYGVDPRTGTTRVLVQPNDGSGTFGQAAVQEGATATNPQTGEKVVYRNGQWQKVGGGAGNGANNFQR